MFKGVKLGIFKAKIEIELVDSGVTNDEAMVLFFACGSDGIEWIYDRLCNVHKADKVILGAAAVSVMAFNKFAKNASTSDFLTSVRALELTFKLARSHILDSRDMDSYSFGAAYVGVKLSEPELEHNFDDHDQCY